MGKPTDAERGIQDKGKGIEEKQLRNEISKSFRLENTKLEKEAREDVNHARNLWAILTHRHFSTSTDRRIYTRYYIKLFSMEGGNPLLDDDSLFWILVDIEGQFQVHEQELQEKWARIRQEQFEVQKAKEIGRNLPMNPVDNFESDTLSNTPDPNKAIAQARADPRWVEKGIVHSRVEDDSYTLFYENGDILIIPTKAISDNPLDKFAITFIRRHKPSGRIIPCQIPQQDLFNIGLRNLRYKDFVYLASPRFDPLLTPTIYFGFVEAQKLYIGRGVAKVLLNTTGSGLIRSGTRPLFRAIAPPITGTVVLGRGALVEVRFAITKYGYSAAAAKYLGHSASAFYLKNAVEINTAVVVGTELMVGFAGGGDIGPISPGDSLSFAIQSEKKVWQIVDAEVASIADDITSQARAIVKSVKPSTPDEVEDLFASGKLIHHDNQVPLGKADVLADDSRVVMEATDNTSVNAATRATGGTGVVADVAKGKGKGKGGKPVLPPSNINLVEIINESDAQKLVQLGVKPEAVAKLRQIEIGELQKIGIKPEQLTKLYAKLRTSLKKGGVVVDFINEFYDKPGFQQVVFNWAKGGISQRGTNFMMRYCLSKFTNQPIRFEWPVGIKKTAKGEDTWARYIDIVIDGGTNIRPGEALRIELKSWTSKFLSFAKSQEGVTKQLVRDTAFFTPQNIRWVFDLKKITREEVLKTFVEIVKKDPYLKKHWGGTEDEIINLLNRVIEVF